MCSQECSSLGCAFEALEIHLLHMFPRLPHPFTFIYKELGGKKEQHFWATAFQAEVAYFTSFHILLVKNESFVHTYSHGQLGNRVV